MSVPPQRKGTIAMTLLELLQLLKKHLALVIALPIVCAIAMGVVAFGFMPNTYTASTSMYVLAQPADENTSSLQSSLSTSQLITNDVVSLIKSDRIKADTAEDLGLDNLSGFDITVTSSTTTRIIDLSVESTDARMAAEVANAMVANVSEVAQQVMKVESVNVIDDASVPIDPSGPRRTMYVAVAFLAGLFLAVAIVVLMDMLNTKVRSAEELEEMLGVPVIGRFPAVKKGK